MPNIAEIHIHPVKSMRGHPVESARFGPDGLEGDRRLALIDPAGIVLSAKYTKALLGLQARIEGDALVIEDSKGGDSRTVLLKECEVREVEAELHEAPLLVERFCDPKLDVWLAERIGKQCYLARSRAGFFDLRPVSVQSRATTEELAKAAGVSLEAERFRPNFVIENAPARAEDSWRSFEVGGVNFEALGRIERCNMTMVHPDTLAVGKEPIATLSSGGSAPRLGAYFAPSATGEVEVGQPLLAR